MSMKRMICAALVAILLPTVSFGFETRATAAWIYDMTTNTVLMDKNGNVPVPPASMSKLMTLNMLFESLRDGRVALDTTFPVSAAAVEMTTRGGSTMYLQQGDRPTVEELIRGIIVNSGNDACIVVAEGLAGSEATFAAQMTKRAAALGMTQSTFANASGWPAPNHRMSMRDLGMLSRRLIEEFPELYPIFAETEFNYKNRAPANSRNRNPLLGLGIGADGLKTGHTVEAGYGLAGSVKQGNRRIIFVISGLDSEKARAEEAESLANWAFRQFALKPVAKSGQRLAEAQVFLGAVPSVGLVAGQDVEILVPAIVQGKIPAEVVYSGPLTAPIAKGTQVAELVIQMPDLPEHRIPLFTAEDVAKAGVMGHLTAAFDHAMARFFGASDPAPAS